MDKKFLIRKSILITTFIIACSISFALSFFLGVFLIFITPLIGCIILYLIIKSYKKKKWYNLNIIVFISLFFIIGLYFNFIAAMGI